MAEDLTIVQGDKATQYSSLIPQIRSLIEGETDRTANLANVAAALKEQFGWLWVGFYLVKQDPAGETPSADRLPGNPPSAEEEQLVVGPFQGPVACTRIRKGRGVCGACWEKAETIIVPDVEAFPGHIACSSMSRSEIVVPLFNKGRVTGVLDVDSRELDAFDDTDRRYLEEIAALLDR